MAEQDPLDGLRSGWDQLVEFGLANPFLYSVLCAPTDPSGTPAAFGANQALADLVHRVAEAGQLRVPEPDAVFSATEPCLTSRAADGVEAAGR